jgi:hypothetical protein
MIIQDSYNTYTLPDMDSDWNEYNTN